MSIDYTLRISFGLPMANLKNLLSAFDGFVPANDHYIGPGLDGIWILPETAVGKSVIQDALGFVPNFKVAFRVNKHDYDIGTHAMLRLLIGLLRQTPNDAALLFNNDALVFLRKDGQLKLNNEFGFWTPAYLADVTMPYTVESRKFYFV